MSTLSRLASQASIRMLLGLPSLTEPEWDGPTALRLSHREWRLLPLHPDCELSQ